MRVFAGLLAGLMALTLPAAGQAAGQACCLFGVDDDEPVAGGGSLTLVLFTTASPVFVSVVVNPGEPDDVIAQRMVRELQKAGALVTLRTDTSVMVVGMKGGIGITGCSIAGTPQPMALRAGALFYSPGEPERVELIDVDHLLDATGPFPAPPFESPGTPVTPGTATATSAAFGSVPIAFLDDTSVSAALRAAIPLSLPCLEAIPGGGPPLPAFLVPANVTIPLCLNAAGPFGLDTPPPDATGCSAGPGTQVGQAFLKQFAVPTVSSSLALLTIGAIALGGALVLWRR